MQLIRFFLCNHEATLQNWTDIFSWCRLKTTAQSAFDTTNGLIFKSVFQTFVSGNTLSYIKLFSNIKNVTTAILFDLKGKSNYISERMLCKDLDVFCYRVYIWGFNKDPFLKFELLN